MAHPKATAVLDVEDLRMVQGLLEGASCSVDVDACPSVHRAVEAVLAALNAGQPLDTSELEPQARAPSQGGEASTRQAASSVASTVAELSAQVSAAAGRVTELRRSVTSGVVLAVAAQAEALRPVLRAGEMTLSTPGKADRRRSMDVDMVPPSAALQLNEHLMQAVDKLPALRARMEEVAKRMSNVLRAIEDQKAVGKMQPTPLRERLTPMKRAAGESDSVVGVIARATCQ